MRRRSRRSATGPSTGSCPTTRSACRRSSGREPRIQNPCIPHVSDKALQVCLALTIAVTGCIGRSGADTRPSPRAYVLLANNHLLVADIASGAVVSELTLAGPSAPSAVRAMALSSDRGSLFVLVSEANGRALVAAVDALTLKVT